MPENSRCVIEVGIDGAEGAPITINGTPVADELLPLLRTIGRSNMDSRTGPELWHGEHLWSVLSNACSDTPHFVELVEGAGAKEDLLAIPWESMVPTDLGVSGVLSGNLVVTRRTRQQSDPKGQPSEELPIKIVALESFGDAPSTDWQELLREVLDAGIADLMILGDEQPLTPQTLRRALDKWKPNVVFCPFGDDKEIALDESPWIDSLLYLAQPPRLIVLYERRPVSWRYRRWSAGHARLAAAGAGALIGVPFLEASKSPPFWALLLREICSGQSIAAACARASYPQLGNSHETAWRPFVVYVAEQDFSLVRLPGVSAVLQRGSRSEVSGAPFIGLRPYGPEDQEVFFGREEETSQIAMLLLSQGRLLLVGESGVGKSSIISAGLAPRFRTAGHATLLIQRFNPSSWIEELDERPSGLSQDEPTVDAILAAIDTKRPLQQNRRVIVFLDQAEDLGQLQPTSRRRLLAELSERASADGQIRLLLAVRSYSAGWLREELREAIPGLSNFGEMTLESLSLAQGEEILNRLEGQRNFQLEPKLKNKLFRDLAGDAIAGEGEDEGDSKGNWSREAPLFLPAFSLLLQRLYRRRQRRLDGDQLLSSEYPEKGVRGLMEGQLRQLIADLPPMVSVEAEGVLARMIDPTTGRPLAVSAQELGQLTQVDTVFIQDILDTLATAQFVRPAPAGRYELVHEILAVTIRDEFMRKDIVERDQLRTELQAGAADFRETGETLPIEWIDRFGNRVDWLKASTAELAFLFGSLVLDKPETMESELAPYLQSLQPSMRVEMIQYLAQSSHPKAVAAAAALAQSMSPIYRKLAPIPLPEVAGKEPSSRFLAESLLGSLSRAALGIAEKDKSQSDVARRQRLALDVLERWCKPNQPRTAASELPEVLGEKWLPGWGLNLQLWPGPWVSLVSISVFTFLGGGLVSRLLWTSGTQSLDGVFLVWALVWAVLLGTVSFIVDSEIESLFETSDTRSDAWQSRLRRLIRYGSMGLLYPVILYGGLHFFGSLAQWVDEGVFSIDTWSRLASPVTNMPWNLNSTAETSWNVVLDYLYSLPLLGPQVEIVLASLQDNWFAKIIIVAIGLVLSLLIWMFALSFIVLQPAGLIIALAPLTILGVGSILACAQFLPIRAGKGRLSNLVGLATCGSLVVLAAPWACGFSAFLMELLQKNLWRSSWVLEQAQLLQWIVRLRDAADSGLIWHLALWPPIAFVLLTTTSSRSFRKKLWRFKGKDDKRSSSELRPLIAEGTFESLLLALDLVDRQESMRDAESFSLVWLLSTEGTCSVLEGISAEEKGRLADRAVEVIHGFDEEFFSKADLLKELGAPADELSDKARRRFRQLQMCVKNKTFSAKIKAQDNSPEEVPSGVSEVKVLTSEQVPVVPMKRKLFELFRRLGLALLVLAMIAFFLVMLITSDYLFRGLGYSLIGILYPVIEPFPDHAWDMTVTVRFWLRFIQVVAFTFVVFLPFTLPSRYRNFKARMAAKRETKQHE